MEKSVKFFKIYYILMIIYAIMGFIDGYLSYVNSTFGDLLIWSYSFSFIVFGVFVLSIIAIFNFRKNGLSRTTFIIPIYHIVFQTIIVIYAIFLAINSIASGIDYTNIVIPSWFTLVAIISSLFELIFSIYILLKFRVKNQINNQQD